MCCNEILSYIMLVLKCKRFDPLTHQDIQAIGEELIPDFPEFPGLQENPHHEVCLSVCLSLPWEDPALSKLSYIIAFRLRLTWSYRTVS